ncbi:MAG: response regulator [DPANN group archaeon]|nr:response regulator [DPANN group archaeon]
MKTILAVDDEESLRQLIEAIFEQEGYHVLTASSGQECLDLLQKEKPDLILMDMMMPGMSGRETIENIRKNPKTKDQKIIFLTVARFSETGKDVLGKLKVLDYITKPFENADLIKTVKKHLGR